MALGGLFRNQGKDDCIMICLLAVCQYLGYSLSYKSKYRVLNESMSTSRSHNQSKIVVDICQNMGAVDLHYAGRSNVL